MPLREVTWKREIRHNYISFFPNPPPPPPSTKSACYCTIHLPMHCKHFCIQYLIDIPEISESALTCSLSVRRVRSAHGINPLMTNSCIKIRKRSWSLSSRHAPCVSPLTLASVIVVSVRELFCESGIRRSLDTLLEMLSVVWLLSGWSMSRPVSEGGGSASGPPGGGGGEIQLSWRRFS